MEKKYVKYLLIGVISALIAYSIAIMITGFDEVESAVRYIDGSTWALLVLLSSASFAIRFFRWQFYLHQLGHRVDYFVSLLYYLSGFALTLTPGKVGETMRSLYLKNHGVELSNSLACFVVERFTDLLAIVFLSTMALTYFSGSRLPFYITACAIFLAIVFIRYAPMLIRLTIGKVRNKRLNSVMTSTEALLLTASALLRPYPLLIGFLFGLIAWGIQGMTLFYILSSINIPVELDFAVGSYAIGLLAGALSFIPGGLGSAEATMVFLLIGHGITSTDATATTLIARVVTLWYAVIVGLISIFSIEALEKRNTIPAHSKGKYKRAA